MRSQKKFIFQIWMTEVTRSLIRVKLFMLDLNAYCWTFHCKATPVQPLHASGEGGGAGHVDPCWLSFTYLNLQLPRRQGTGECCLDRRKDKQGPDMAEEGVIMLQKMKEGGCLANSPPRIHTYLQILRHCLLADFQSPTPKTGQMTYFD